MSCASDCADCVGKFLSGMKPPPFALSPMRGMKHSETRKNGHSWTVFREAELRRTIRPRVCGHWLQLPIFLSIMPTHRLPFCWKQNKMIRPTTAWHSDCRFFGKQWPFCRQPECNRAVATEDTRLQPAYVRRRAHLRGNIAALTRSRGTTAGALRRFGRARRRTPGAKVGPSRECPSGAA